MNQWEYFNQRAKELERYNYKTPGVNVADQDGSVWKKRREIDNAQLQTAAKLEKLQEQFEQSQIEQAKENRVDRWFAIASLVVAVVSLAVAILK